MTGISNPLDELAALVQAQRGQLLEILSADGLERAQASWRAALAALPELESRLRDYLTGSCNTEPERRQATVLLAETRQRLRATGLLVLTLARLGRAELAACTTAHSAGQMEPPTYAPAGPSGPAAVVAPQLLCQDA
ncbi:MAG: hypothetical protein C4289_14280 [Chloroflexota bacterium]